ncbi:MAG: hypothetical protein HY861_01290 [Chlamydiia bacterium]|nr:hypothetical protein [Chlamydiia bacterium]
MNKINSIYTTVSRGQVHIAADTKYIGSIDSYNNGFTQFFAWLFGRSMAVNFDGKVRSVNKESYTNLIRSFTQNDAINDIGQCSIFRPIAEAATLPTGNLKMRDVIISADRQALFQKLAIAISRGDTTKALLMIGKGAELDTAYYDRGQLSPSFSRDTSDLGSNSRYTFTVFCAAPILQAARKGNVVVCKFLQDAGANLSVSGKGYAFKREITNVDSRLELAAQPRLVARPCRIRDAKGHDHDSVHYRVEYRPQLRERTIVTTQDSRSGEKNYQLDQVDFSVVEV